jgi:hypothetical protein
VVFGLRIVKCLSCQYSAHTSSFLYCSSGDNTFLVLMLLAEVQCGSLRRVTCQPIGEFQDSSNPALKTPNWRAEPQTRTSKCHRRALLYVEVEQYVAGHAAQSSGYEIVIANSSKLVDESNLKAVQSSKSPESSTRSCSCNASSCLGPAIRRCACCLARPSRLFNSLRAVASCWSVEV